MARVGPGELRVSRIAGTKVHGTNGERLGEVKDLVLDLAADRVRYLVLEFGGFLGLGERLYALPASAFTASRQAGTLVLTVDHERLRQAPAFARGNWPDWGTLGVDVDRYWAVDKAPLLPGAQAKRDATMRRIGELLGADVRDAAGQEVGEISDAVVRLRDGAIRYLVVAIDRSWGSRDKSVQLPPSALDFQQQPGRVVLRVPRDELSQTLAPKRLR